MTYKEATEWIEANKNLIGKVTEKGFVYRELVIVPADNKDREAFLRNYVLSYNNQAAIIPYMGGDLQVWGIDIDMIRKHNLLLYHVLA